MKKNKLLISCTRIAAVGLLSFLHGKTQAEEAANGNGFAGAYRASKNYAPPRDPLVLKKLAQFQDLKFGFMMHWGAYSQWGIDASWTLCPERYDWNKRPLPYQNATDSEYKKAYEHLQTTFNPVKFDPDQWAAVAQEAGTRYVVFTTKHHDGFCMWDTAQTDYKITSARCPFHTNPHADVVKAVFDAFRNRGFWIGAYFSKPDWNCPWFWDAQFPLKDRDANYDPLKQPELWKKFKDFTRAQIRELMTGYGKIDILWLDGGWVRPSINHQDIDMPGIAAMARKSQPGLLVVDRTVGGGCEDYLTPEGTHAMPANYQPYPWEACMTLGHGWAYNPHTTYMSAGEVIRYLVPAVARNGNLLLDVGPDANGELPPEAVARLREIGAWLKINGDAIYETRPLPPYETHDGVFFTHRRDGKRYAIVLGNDDAAGLPEFVTLPAKVVENIAHVSLLGSSTKLATQKAANGDLVVRFPATLRAHPPCTYGWTIRLTSAL